MTSISGTNNPESRDAFADIVKGARNRFEWDNAAVAMDADSWPLVSTFSYVYQESGNDGISLDPLIRGTIAFQFNGSATVTLSGVGNHLTGSISYSYNAGTNLTTGTFTTEDRGFKASSISFASAYRDGISDPGITNLKMMKPIEPDSTTTYSTSTLWTTHILAAMSYFQVIRYQLLGSQMRDWADRTPPAYFNQRLGTSTAQYYDYAYSDPSDNGWSWEHRVALCNAAGCDLYIGVPPLATDAYITNLANLIKYGSDGTNPYTSVQGSPVWAPLDSGRNVYFEIGNELWNQQGPFNNDYMNINLQVVDSVVAEDANYDAFNYDGLTTATDVNGNYSSMQQWRYRFIMLRTIQMSDLFRAVFGDDDMPGTSADPRVRPCYQWQYGNYNGTALYGLTWADRYYRKTDAASTYSGSATPVSHWIWGGGGASYYSAQNGPGVTDLLEDPSFETPLVAGGYTQAPVGSPWTFDGTAGIARYTDGTDGIPTPYEGDQVGYITDLGSITGTFTVPADQVSNLYSVCFKAHNRKLPAVAVDVENVRVYLDYGTADEIDITARANKQANGYVAPGIATITPWKARMVGWSESQYYTCESVELVAGSTHTITIKGMGDITTSRTDQTVLIEDFRISSVDAIFDGGIPGSTSGEANGQPVGTGIKTTLEVSAQWCKAFGLKQVAYESGWSLGGDDGGSFIQLKAKYGDARTADAQDTFMSWFDGAGGVANIFGTYAQWPSWRDYYGEQGMEDISVYPIMQSIIAHTAGPQTEPNAGNLMPLSLGLNEIKLAYLASETTGQITTAGGWFVWMIWVPTTGDYDITVTTTSTSPHITFLLLIDDVEIASVTDTAVLSVTETLAEGLYALKVRSTLGIITVTDVTIVGDAPPDAPTITSFTPTTTSATLMWGAVTGATGYVVRYGLSYAELRNRVDVGNVLTSTVSGLTSGDIIYFSVSAYNATGESLPSDTESVIMLEENVVGNLALFNFQGLCAPGTVPPTTYPADVTVPQITVGELTRGAGLLPSNAGSTATFPNRFLSKLAGGGSYNALPEGALEYAIASDQFVYFLVTPKPGSRITFTELDYIAFGQTTVNFDSVLQFSTDGTTFVSAETIGTPNSNYVADLSIYPELSNVTSPVTFRMVITMAGSSSGRVQAIGKGTNVSDITLSGEIVSIAASSKRMFISYDGGKALLLQW
jgi:hypothetical protein